MWTIRVARAGAQVFVDLCRRPVADYLQRFGFRSDLLRAMYAVTDGVSGLTATWDMPGSGLNFLCHNMVRGQGFEPCLVLLLSAHGMLWAAGKTPCACRHAASARVSPLWHKCVAFRECTSTLSAPCRGRAPVPPAGRGGDLDGGPRRHGHRQQPAGAGAAPLRALHCTPIVGIACPLTADAARRLSGTRACAGVPAAGAPAGTPAPGGACEARGGARARPRCGRARASRPGGPWRLCWSGLTAPRGACAWPAAKRRAGPSRSPMHVSSLSLLQNKYKVRTLSQTRLCLRSCL